MGKLLLSVIFARVLSALFWSFPTRSFREGPVEKEQEWTVLRMRPLPG